MNSLSFPDINVWLAIAAPEHVHAAIARRWWEQETGIIAFSRLTQLGFLRLMTTAAAMDGKPLTITAAWRVYDRLYEDDRVTLSRNPQKWRSGFVRKHRDERRLPKFGPMHGCSRLPMRRRGFWSRLTKRLHRGVPTASLSKRRESIRV
jgi:predicted nucleic acid-binding protein